jgi:hypothetical protein
MARLQESVLVDPSMAIQLRPEFADAFEMGTGDNQAMLAIQQFIGELAIADWVEGTRQTIGEIAQVAGVLSSGFNQIDTIFDQKTSDVMKGFDIAGMVLDSEVFNMAMNAIGAIPIVGWIVKIVYEIARSIAGFVEAAKNEDAAAARRAFAKGLSIPIGATNFDPKANDLMAMVFFRCIAGYQSNTPDQLLRPSYRMDMNAPNMGFNAYGVKRKDGDDMATGWIVAADEAVGMGFVPGSSSITRSLFFPAGISTAPNTCGIGCGGGAMRDMGTLYPTAQNLCTTWWSQINKPGPAMYTVQPRKWKNEWSNYVEHMYALIETVLMGWTCAPTGKPFTDRFKCYSPELTCGGGRKKRQEGMGSCDHDNRGKELRIPSDFGRSSHTAAYGYLCQLFFGIQDPFKQSKGGLDQLPRVGSQSYSNDLGSKFYRADALNMDKSVPVAALENLYIRQKASLKSLNCMYVNGEDNGRDQFAAFHDSSLRNQWRQSVTDVFSSGSWRRVVFQDMPDGPAKNDFYQYAKSKGISDVENYNRPCLPGEDPRSSNCGPPKVSQMLSAGSQIPTDPSLPAPPMNTAVVKAELIRDIGGTGSRRGKKSSNLPLLLGAGAVAFLLLKGRK